MMRGLAAIAAIFRAAAGLDVEQLAELHAVRIEMPAVNGLRLEQQIVERQPVERPRRFVRPLRSVRKRRRHSCFIPHFEHSSTLPILIASCGRHRMLAKPMPAARAVLVKN
jgi:hypothetical protein